MISDLKYPFHLQSQDNQGFHALPAATSGKKSEVFQQLHSSVFSVHSLRVEWAIEWVAGRGYERRRYLLNSRHVPRKVLVVILCGISLTARINTLPITLEYVCGITRWYIRCFACLPVLLPHNSVSAMRRRRIAHPLGLFLEEQQVNASRSSTRAHFGNLEGWSESPSPTPRRVFRLKSN